MWCLFLYTKPANTGNEESDELRNVQTICGLFMFLVLNQTSGALYSTLYPFILERPVFLREYANKSYKALPYFLSKSLFDLPFQIIMPLCISVVIYFFTLHEQQSFEKFLIFILTLIATAGYGTSMGFLLGCIFDNLATAM